MNQTTGHNSHSKALLAHTIAEDVVYWASNAKQVYAPIFLWFLFTFSFWELTKLLTQVQKLLWGSIYWNELREKKRKSNKA